MSYLQHIIDLTGRKEKRGKAAFFVRIGSGEPFSLVRMIRYQTSR